MTGLFRILWTVCFCPTKIDLTNDGYKTGRSKPEKLPSNFQFQYFDI